MKENIDKLDSTKIKNFLMEKNTTKSRHVANKKKNGHRTLTDNSQRNKYSWLLNAEKKCLTLLIIKEKHSKTMLIIPFHQLDRKFGGTACRQI